MFSGKQALNLTREKHPDGPTGALRIKPYLTPARYTAFKDARSGRGTARTGWQAGWTRSDNTTILFAVDLDGTLTTDLLWKVCSALRAPLCLFMLRSGAVGPARLKQEIAAREHDPTLPPYRAEVVERIRAERAAGRQTILATGTPRKFAEAIAAHLGIFDRVMATDGLHNLTSSASAPRCAKFGDGGFDHVGNSR